MSSSQCRVRPEQTGTAIMGELLLNTKDVMFHGAINGHP